MRSRNSDDLDLEPPPPRAPLRRRPLAILRLACAIGLALMALLALVRLTGLDSGTMLALPIAVLPQAALGTVVLALLLLMLNRRRLALIALALLIAQVAWLAPRFVPDNPGDAPGPQRLRVGTCNSHAGGVDPKALVELARAQRLDVLAVEELTAEGVRALDEAGMGELMPYRELHPEVDSSIYSRLPLAQAGLLNRGTTWPQVTAEVSVGARTVRLVAVHTYFPPGGTGRWANDLAALTTEARDAGKDVVMLGDFNATLDHKPMRALLAAGLIDTHAELGRGWAPTWPVGGIVPPLAQLDHVLHGTGLAAVQVGEHTLPGTDHRAVVAELALAD